MLKVETERDHVILVFENRGRDLLLSPDQARSLADALERAAGYCEEWTRAGGRGHLFRGEPWMAHVESWDGKVNVRFSQTTDRVRLPAAAARGLATEIRAKAPEAEVRMRITWRPNLIGV